MSFFFFGSLVTVRTKERDRDSPVLSAHADFQEWEEDGTYPVHFHPVCCPVHFHPVCYPVHFHPVCCPVHFHPV